jgi:hypothetical protein
VPARGQIAPHYLKARRGCDVPETIRLKRTRTPDKDPAELADRYPQKTVSASSLLASRRRRSLTSTRSTRRPAEQGPKLGDILEKEVDPKYTLTEHLWKYLQNYKAGNEGASFLLLENALNKGGITRLLGMKAVTLDQRTFKRQIAFGYGCPVTAHRWTPSPSS